MKQVKLVMGVLLLLLMAQAITITGDWGVSAGIYCDDIRGCKGEAGCTENGSREGPCDLKCSDGTWAHCLKEGRGGLAE